MATERYEYAAVDSEGKWWPMPLWMAEAVADEYPSCSTWRRVVRTDGTQVTHGEWHPVTAGGN